MGTSLVYSPRFLEHDTGWGHPERPERLEAIIDSLQKTDLWKQLVLITPDIKDPQIPELVHDPDYVKRVAHSCDRADQYIDTYDNPICSVSYSIAVLAANGVATGLDYVMKDQGNCSMVIPRPPGHHAEYDHAMGFCLFNNVAIAARYAQQKYSVTRVAIIDFDVHHGNGTQHLFENDPNIIYISTHRYPFYPGSGAKNETGMGDGLGTTLNYPLDQGTGDEVYCDIIDNSVADVVLKFNPELMILSSGFDAHELDPLGGMALTTAGYKMLSHSLISIAKECCDGRVLSVLEGGYSLQGLKESMEVHLREIMNE